MKNFYSIFKKEMEAYFFSPIAYVVITIFIIISGYFFFNIISFYNFISFSVGMRSSQMGSQLNVIEMVLKPLYSNLAIVLLLIVPLLTMRLLSEEKKQGTIELLFTYPIRDGELIMGKFVACLAVYGVMLATTFIYPVMISFFGDMEWGPVFSAYLGLLLMGSSFISIGILFSSTTENQIIAAVSTFGMLLILWVINASERFVGPGLAVVLKELSIIGHFDNFAKGVIDTRDLIFYLNFSFLFIFLTLRSLESKKWRGA
mgnify:FL=1